MLNHRYLWSLDGLSRVNVLALIDSAQALKRAAQGNGLPQPLRGKNVALLSDDHTNAAAAAFQRAAAELGAQVAHIRASDPGVPDRRDPRDTAGLLGQLYDAIECEGLSDEEVRQFDRNAGIPVYNGVGSLDHPTRLIADLMTLQEATGEPLDRLCVQFAGDLQGPAGKALEKVAALVGLELERVADAQKQPVAASAACAGVVEAARTPVVCAAGADGRLPLRLLVAGTATAQALFHAQVSNQRHVLQALLIATMD
jgi:ornithine carbamoyltransferase